MNNSIYKFSLLTTIPVLCVLVLLNAFLVSRNLTRIQKSVTMRAEASEAQLNISEATLSIQTMETSQRGYLLTGDPSYLKPYNEASAQLGARFTKLRSVVGDKDRDKETQLESVVQAKVAEMQETIRLRQQGYRHRAFVIVDSNRGQRSMGQARALLDGLAASQASAMARDDAEFKDSVGRAIKESALASTVLLAMAVVAFFAFHQYRSRLEMGYARHDEELRETRQRLEQLSRAMFNDCRALLVDIQEHANALLDGHGSFLPRQGHEQVERIESGAGQMIAVLDGLSSGSPNAPAVAVREVESLSA